ncbi:TPA: phage tail protein [Yersinia enterocolitica]|nr:tail fiber protein [Yersinia enterocolitica]HDL8228623.1 tail fiber protein [Yersinia enterocolitica]HDM9021840.1 tail fiber protein [Yersinia enterocolitica]HEC4987259.1 tail fiber protein [Yersinia enterocolitica]HEI6871888.1 tail fiber protein [Yersinia enterocolitica]
MHRIDTPTAQVDKFGAGKNGFTRGNPQTGVPATALDDDYFDAVQEELAGVVEAAGFALNKANRAQLLAAIQKLVSEGIPDLKDATVNQKGIVQLSNATDSNSQILAATPKAVSDLGNLLLKITNNLSEIKDAGPAAVAQTLLNLGLGDAAKLGVATDAEVIAGLVGKAITAATLKSRFASVVLYPSGTEAVPPTLTAGQRIVIDNPFPGRPVSAEVEVFANGIWDSPNIMVAPQGNGGPSAGAKAKYLFDSDKIVIQTAGNGVLYLSIYSGSAHNFLSGGDVFSGTIFSARQYRLRVRTL